MKVTKRWVPLWGEDFNYMVSECGEVMSFKSKTVAQNKGPILMKWQKFSTGYYFVKTNGEIHSVHAIVYYSFAGTRPPGGRMRQINHLDGDKANNSLNNLEVVSAKENARHRTYELQYSAWGNQAIPTTVTVLSTGEVLNFPSRRALWRQFKSSEVQIHAN